VCVCVCARVRACVCVFLCARVLMSEFYIIHPYRFEDEARVIPPMLKNLVFGMGPRYCIGNSLALYAMKLALISILRHFRFVQLSGSPVSISGLFEFKIELLV
jgi:cytochrome P450